MKTKILQSILALVFLVCLVSSTACADSSKNVATPAYHTVKTMAFGGDHLVAITTKGTVLATGSNEYGQCNVGSWTDIVSIAANNRATFGLKADGTVVGVGYDSVGVEDIAKWNDIVAITCGVSHVVGLKSDGTVVIGGVPYHEAKEVLRWENIVAIAAGQDSTFGLKADGTVVCCAADHGLGGYDVSGWKNIIAIAAGNYHAVGLQSDGTLVGAGYGGNRLRVTHWENIAAIDCGNACTVGLKANGTVVVRADESQINFYGNGWKNVVSVLGGDEFTVALMADGTVSVYGEGFTKQYNVKGWKNIAIPYASGTAHKTLREGSTGKNVTKMKERMRELGYFTAGSMSDKYNTTTIERVKQFQKANGLAQTGIADHATLAVLYSNNAKAKPTTAVKITQQPANATANIGEVVNTTVTATGADLTYTWYIRNPASANWGKSSVTGKTYSCRLTEAYSGRQAYCIVTDANGNCIVTNTVTLSIP
ncbi:MAG: peptidoglycan-binding protein [Clostridia bacterium]|nr:peptidoglycan-binding protein [Clostridia bacterium]